MVVGLPIFFITRVANHDHIKLPRLGKVVAVISVGLWAEVVPKVDCSRAANLHMRRAFVSQQVAIR